MARAVRMGAARWLLAKRIDGRSGSGWTSVELPFASHHGMTLVTKLVTLMNVVPETMSAVLYTHTLM